MQNDQLAKGSWLFHRPLSTCAAPSSVPGAPNPSDGSQFPRHIAPGPLTGPGPPTTPPARPSAPSPACPPDCTTGHAKLSTAGPVPLAASWTSDTAGPTPALAPRHTATAHAKLSPAGPVPPPAPWPGDTAGSQADRPRCAHRPGATGRHLALAPSPARPLSLTTDPAKANAAGPAHRLHPGQVTAPVPRLSALDALTAQAQRTVTWPLSPPTAGRAKLSTTALSHWLRPRCSQPTHFVID